MVLPYLLMERFEPPLYHQQVFTIHSEVHDRVINLASALQYSVPSVSHGNAASATKQPHHDQIDRIVNESYSKARTTYKL